MSNNRGGSREGSGRKLKYNEPTKTVRVPVSKIIEIKNYLGSGQRVFFVSALHLPFVSSRKNPVKFYV